MKTVKPQSGTLKTIAEEAGCSPSTVSRVLNGRQKGFSVCKELEERIHALAARHNYQPNPFLRIMRAEDSKVIAIFDPLTNSSSMLMQAKAAFVGMIRQNGYTETGKYVSLYRQDSYTLPFPVAAALLFDISDPAFLAFLEERAIPYVVINGMSRTCGAAIQLDEEKNIRAVMDGLCENGHRRIAFYGAHKDAGRKHQHYSGILREQYFREELRARGLPQPPETLSDLLDPEEFLTRIRSEFEPTAILCYDHARALGILAAAVSAKLHLPDDLSLVSLTDDFPLGQLPMPIAALAAPGTKMGECAAELIFKLLNDTLPEEERTVLLRSRLYKRQSIADLNNVNA